MYVQFHQLWFDALMIVYANNFDINQKIEYNKTQSFLFFQSLMMESLEQLSSNNLEVVGIEINSVNCKVINTDRNKFEAIPKTIQVPTNIII